MDFQFGDPLGFVQVNVTTARGLPSIPPTATVAVINIEGSAIRWRDDGKAPTLTTGMPIGAGSTFSYSGALPAFSMIALAGSSIVNVSYYRQRFH